MPSNVEEIVSGVVKDVNVGGIDFSRFIKAAAILVIGMITIRILMKIVDRALKRANNIGVIGGYLRSVLKVILWVIVLLVVVDAIGVPVTSLVALLSVAALAISLALQNTLANVASGIMLLVAKPMEAGDYVEVDGVGGTVEIIGLAYSTLATPDNKEIFMPNSQISAAKIVNYTRLGKRRVDWSFTASYDAPTETVKTAISEVLEKYPQILPDPAPVIYVSNYGASSIEYVVRVWTASADYWPVYYGVMEDVRAAFQRHNVEMTYDHLNVHLLNQ